MEQERRSNAVEELSKCQEQAFRCLKFEQRRNKMFSDMRRRSVKKILYSNIHIKFLVSSVRRLSLI